MFIRLTTIIKFDNVQNSKLKLDRPCSTLVPIDRIEYIIEGNEGTVVELGNKSETFVVTESVEELVKLLSLHESMQ